MCTWATEQGAKNMMARFRRCGTGVVVCYKGLLVSRSFVCIEEPAFVSPIKWKEYKPGVVKSNSRKKKPQEHGVPIFRGIHVFTNIQRAKESGYEVILPVYCKVEDFIGADHEECEAVFKKVYLRQDKYDQAMKKVKEL
ncbi:MAG: hypothetical protein ACXABY_03285 [Candidatus Thorarchaeota archaeon]|jgi:hypothetical protein